MNTENTKILEIINLSSDVNLFKLQKPNNFNYLPGQFIMIQIGQFIAGERPIWRAYSICSRPEDTTLDFTIKFVPDGKASEYLKTCKVGMDLVIRGPMGQFLIDNSHERQIFIATGIGITPFLPMISKCLEYDQTVDLHFGNKTEDDIVFDGFFSELQNKYPKFSYTKYISRDENTTFKKGRITTYLANEIIHPGANYYICGGREMIQEVREILLNNHVPNERIHKEAFY